MTLASEFQKTTAILKLWWEDGFEQRKMDGKYALCDRTLSGQVSAYLIRYCSKPQYQGRGTLHIHYLALSRPSSDSCVGARMLVGC